MYVYDPEIITAPDHSAAHLTFVNESLKDLSDSLQLLGGCVTYRLGLLEEVPCALVDELSAFGRSVERFLLHDEVATDLIRKKRDKALQLLRERGIEVKEYNQTGVLPTSRPKEGWAKAWTKLMNDMLPKFPERVPKLSITEFDHGFPHTVADFSLGNEARRKEVQRGGERQASQLLRSFLEFRGVNYS